MRGISLHIYGSPITHESRIMNETETLSRLGLVDKVLIVGLWANDLPVEEVVDDKRTILRLKLWSQRLGKSTPAKIIKLTEWMIRIAFTFMTKRVTIVNIHYLAGLPLGVFFKICKRSKLVYDASELETERHGWGSGQRRMAKIVERTLIKLVDETIVASPGYADWYEKAYGKRPHTVLNAPRYTVVVRKDIFREKLHIPQSKTIFLYQGALGTGRSIENILTAFGADINEEKVVVFLGYGTLEQTVREAAKRHANIFFHPAVPPNELLEYTAAADIGFCLIQNTCLSYYYTLPNKMLEYAMAGLPVVVPDFAEMKRLTETYKIGYVLPDSRVETITALIQRVNARDIASFKENLDEFRRVFNWENQEETLINVYRGLWPVPASRP